MAELLVGRVIEKLIDIGFEYLENQFKWSKATKEALERLRDNLTKIEADAVYASDQALMTDKNPHLNKRLWQLRDAIYEADDVLDEIEHMKRGKQLSTNRGKRKVPGTMNLLCETACKLFKLGENALKIDPNLKRIEDVVQKLDKVSADVPIFFRLVKDAKQEYQEQQLELHRAREAGCLPKNDLIGRGKDKENVMNWLRNPSNEDVSLYRNISLLSIVGLGGMGKTTLLQHIYEDVKAEEFDLKMWVCVSKNFNVKQVIANMLESLKNERPCLERVEALQRSLRSEVKSKKFLLVLDDIWDDDNEQVKNNWGKVLAPLAFGKLGSKILVTTRMESVASMFSEVMNKKNETLKLKGLNDDYCLKLLIRSAFRGVDNHDAYHNLRSIAEKSIKKLSGSPLATTVIGGILNSYLEQSHWTRVLNNYIGSQNNIMSILKLSYTSLPKVLQKCLLFCCTFPQDYQLNKDDLVQMWIALDFIQPSINQKETLMDVAERYFDFLVKKSLLDKFQNFDKAYYKLHDLLHDTLRVISAQEYFSIVNDEECVSITPEITRHLYVQTNNQHVLEDVEKFGKLRSLFLTSYTNENAGDLFGMLLKIFKALKSIRLLVIDVSCLGQIPVDIGHLIHLRYLEINKWNNHGRYPLPRSLNNLYHLQFLFIDKSDFQKESFRGIPEVGKLNSLQMLDYFDVRNEVGYRFEELEHMNELSLLAIYFVEDMNDAINASSAKLCDKKNLRDLSLVWQNNKYKSLPQLELNDFKMNAEQNVLDNLKPHNSLKKLRIDSFMGARSAIWMNYVNLFSNLEYIQITGCRKLQTLPPFWQLGALKYLYLEDMPNVKGFDYEPDRNDKVRVFPSLQVLRIVHLQALEDWFVQTAGTDDCLFPCLTELELLNCPNLRELPALPPHLKKLIIYNVGWKGCNWLQGISNCSDISIDNCPDLIHLGGHQEVETNEKCQFIIRYLGIKDPSLLLMEPLRSISSIRQLNISNNDAEISFPPEVEQWFLQVSPSLHELKFQSLKLSQPFPFSLESFSSLKILCIQEAPQLQLLLNNTTSLEHLKLEKIKSLQCPPSCLYFSSLKQLILKSMSLQELPELPPSLWELELLDLSNLHCLPSCLPSLSSLKILEIKNLPELQELPVLPPSLGYLGLSDLSNLHCLPSCLPSLSSLHALRIKNLLDLQELPVLPPSLGYLELSDLSNLHCFPSCLPSLSSLRTLKIKNLPELQELPDLPPSLFELKLSNLSNLHCLPSCVRSLSSLRSLKIENLPELRELPGLPPSLSELELSNLSNLHCLPSCLPSLSSLRSLKIENLPELRELPGLPPSLLELVLSNLSNLHCLPSCLLSLSSLKNLKIENFPELHELPDLPPSLLELKLSNLSNFDCLPSCLPSLSHLGILKIKNLPELSELPELPPSLWELELLDLSNLHCLPSCLPSLSHLGILKIKNLPELLELPELPPSLWELELLDLSNLHCLPSCLPSLSSLEMLVIKNLPELRELPNFPSSLEDLELENCHPELHERYRRVTGSDRHKIACICNVRIYPE